MVGMPDFFVSHCSTFLQRLAVFAERESAELKAWYFESRSIRAGFSYWTIFSVLR
jgi:hypothetical protein